MSCGMGRSFARQIRRHRIPLVFDRSDCIAIEAQNRYLRLRKLDLGLLLVSSAFATLSPDGWWTQQIVAAGILGFMLVSLALSVALQRLKLERPWFDGRVVAESVKTLSYRYMARAEPYDGPADSDADDDQFVCDLDAVVRDREGLRAALAADPEAAVAQRRPITWSMRQIRLMELTRRKAWYLSERIQSQAVWYAARAQDNERTARRWFLFVTAAKVASLAAAAALVWNPETLVKSAGFFAGVASVAMAWNQLRQHQMLAQTYALATQELGSVQDAARDVVTDKAFSVFVADAENAISREHTLWRARRDRG
jgi:hypothetical protein